MTYEESISEFDLRETLVKRMCILSVVVLILSVASLVVGILAVQTSDAKFPFNAGGAIVAGIMALLFTICPMCMFYQAWQAGMFMNDCFDCCTITLAIWAGITVLGIPWGFAVSGIFALIECIHPSEKTGCTKNTDTKIALAVVTIILTSVLMILTLVIFFTCCCNSKTFGVPLLRSDAYGNTNRGTYGLREGRTPRPAGVVNQNDRTADIDQISSFSNDISISLAQVGSRHYHEDFVPRRTAGPVTPPPYDSETNRDHRLNQDANSRTGHESSYGEHDPVGGDARYEDPPPSYDEVMKKTQSVPRETTL